MAIYVDVLVIDQSLMLHRASVPRRHAGSQLLTVDLAAVWKMEARMVQ
jgi:hypothetical protein